MRKAVRSQIERLTRRLVFARRLPPPFQAARILVTPAARLGYAFKPLREAEPGLLRCAETLVRPGQTVWDIGANIGLFSFAAAAMAGAEGRVFAFEPDLHMADLLRRSAAMQPPPLARTDVLAVAIGKENGVRKLNIAARARASNALAEYGGTQMGGVIETHLVPAVSLDWMLTQMRPPDVIKIDVEGAEVEVLQGARTLLADIRPVIVCEVTARMRNAITPLLRDAHYSFYDGDKPPQGASPIAQVTWNTVALPEEKAHLLA
jgi:FkbM family methyltransferase